MTNSLAIKHLIAFTCFIISFSIAVNATAQRIRYVNTEAYGRKDGSSWDNASSDMRK